MNLKDKVKVTLTEKGIEVYRQRNSSRNPRIDPDLEISLWELMQIFGQSLYMTSAPVFKDNKIELVTQADMIFQRRCHKHNFSVVWSSQIYKECPICQVLEMVGEKTIEDLLAGERWKRIDKAHDDTVFAEIAAMPLRSVVPVADMQNIAIALVDAIERLDGGTNNLQRSLKYVKSLQMT